MRKRPGPGELLGAPFKAGDTIGSRYEVKDSVGTGPLGFVLRCHDRELDVNVALKLVHPRLAQSAEEREHFTEVMKGARKFAHPSLARVYDEGVLDQGWLFYTQPFLDGFTLRKIIDLKLSKGQFFSLREIIPILSQLVAALQGTASKGAHGDLKPSNVVLQPDLLKVTDYGLALALPRRPFVQAQKPNQAHRYLAPEYVSGFEVDARADQYSLGVIVGEMLSGLFPEGASLPQLRSKNSELEPAVESFYRKALSERSDGRFVDGNEMLEEFKALGGSLFSPSRTRPEPLPSPEALERAAPPVADSEERTQLEERGAVELREARHLAATQDEVTPADATQPVSAEELARHLSAKRVQAPAVPEPPSTLPLPTPRAPIPPPLPAMTPPPSPVAELRTASFAAGPASSAPAARAAPGEFPTQAWQSIVSEAPGPQLGGGLFAASRRSSVWEQPGLKLGALCVAGLVLGALGGWWFLSRVEKPAPEPPSASVSLTPDAAPLKAAPASPATAPGSSSHASPIVPAGAHSPSEFPRVLPQGKPPLRR